MLAMVSVTLFSVVLILAGTWDVLSRRIPNRLTLLLAGLFIGFASVQGMPASEIMIHALVGLAVLSIGFAAFSFGYLGGGDAKLLGAVALWFGLGDVLQFLVLTTLAGGILALGVLAWFVIMFELQFEHSDLRQRLSWMNPNVPYGFAIAAGAILSVPGSWLDPAASISTWLTQI